MTGLCRLLLILILRRPTIGPGRHVFQGIDVRPFAVKKFPMANGLDRVGEAGMPK